MHIQAIKSFLSVYETQNITRTSESLYVTQQCISQHIKSLESEFGVKLFERKKTGMKPTEICRRIFPDLKKLMLGYDSALKTCASYQMDKSKKLTVAVADGLSKYLNINALAALLNSCEELNLSLEECPENECETQLLTGDADIAFLLEPFDDTMLEHVLILQDYGCVAMHKSNPLAKERGPIQLSELDGLKTVIGAKTNCATEHFERYCRQAGVYPRYVISVSDPNGYINNMRDEDVVAMLLSRSIPMINNPDVVIREIINPRLIGKCHCCIKKGSEKSEMLRELMAHIEKEYENK